MASDKEQWKLVTTKLPEDVHAFVLILKNRYEKNMGDALRDFFSEHDPNTMNQAQEAILSKRKFQELIGDADNGGTE